MEKVYTYVDREKQHDDITNLYYSYEPKPSSEDESDLKIDSNQTEEENKYKQLVYEYYLKSKCFENKCTMLHRNLQEVKDAWENAKLMKDSALKEKDNMILKFANGEKKLLNEKNLREKAENQIKISAHKIELLQKKIHIKEDEKVHISAMYDNKVQELKYMKDENDRLMNDNCMLKNELKLCQIALKNQAELHSKAQNTINGFNKKISFVIGKNFDIERVDEYIEEIQQKLESHEQKYEYFYEHFNDLSMKYHNSLEENGAFCKRIQTLESNICKYEKLLEHEDFTSDNIKNPREVYVDENTLKELNSNLYRLKVENKDLRSDIQSCRLRESDTLHSNQQFSAKNVKLQSENHNLQYIIQALNTEINKLKKLLNESRGNYIALSAHLELEKEKNVLEKKKFLEELDSLRKNSDEQNRQNLNLQQQLFDQQEQLTIIRKKHNFSLREFRKELSYKCNHEIRSSSKSPFSLSLHSISYGAEHTCNYIEMIQPETALNQSILIERILRLQRIISKKTEKIDFLEERVQSLLSELRKKATLLQFYFSRERSEVLSSKQMDQVKFNIKKCGGVMASIYDAKVSDENLTLEISLDINCKLQAILEDVLLRNIILKNNMETLGKEIDKLNKLVEQR